MNEQELSTIKANIFSSFRDVLIPTNQMVVPPPSAIIYIDEQNLMETAKQLSFQIDYIKLRELFNIFFDVKDCWIFTSTVSNELAKKYYMPGDRSRPDMSLTPNVKHTTWLVKNGFKLCTKPVKIFKDKNNEFQMKGNLDVDLAVHAMHYSKPASHVFLFTGDSDFVALVKHLQFANKKVTAISTIHSAFIPLGTELKDNVDNFIDLNDLRPYISRDIKYVPNHNLQN